MDAGGRAGDLHLRAARPAMSVVGCHDVIGRNAAAGPVLRTQRHHQEDGGLTSPDRMGLLVHRALAGRQLVSLPPFASITPPPSPTLSSESGQARFHMQMDACVLDACRRSLI